MDDAIYELPDLPETWTRLWFVKFIRCWGWWYFRTKICYKKQQEDAVLEQIKEDYNFDEIKDVFDKGVVLHQLDCFYDGENSNFNQAFLSKFQY